MYRTTQHLTDDIATDYDADGYLAGIEIVGARELVGDEIPRQGADYEELGEEQGEQAPAKTA